MANAVAAKSVQLNILTSQWEMSFKQAEQRATMLTQQRKKTFNELQLAAPIPDFND
uniref:Uncharacterized protein n=1 Tax=Yersinia ruckeri TaxID=29486 RepID=A0A0A8VE55_YERRU|nr:hypothetical protein CSF007_11625 [Yersinia ruckeri]